MTRPKKADKTSLEARLSALKARHAQLEQDIEQEQRRPLPSMSRLRALKSRKLMLKDELTYYDGVVQTLSSMGRSEPQGAA